MKCNGKLCPDYFSVNVFALAVVFCREISKNQQFYLKLSVFGVCWQNTTASKEIFTEK